MTSLASDGRFGRAALPQLWSDDVARPRKTKAEQRSDRVGVRFTLAERAFLEEQALASGVTVTELVRRRALRLPAPPPRVGKQSSVNAALVSELNRIGVNLNQLAYAANVGRTERPHWERLSGELSRVLERLVMPRGS